MGKTKIPIVSLCFKEGVAKHSYPRKLYALTWRMKHVGRQVKFSLAVSLAVDHFLCIWEFTGFSGRPPVEGRRVISILASKCFFVVLFG